MASYNFLRVQDADFGNLDSEITSCEACNSTDIKYEPTGYVCGNCGLVLSELVIRYDRPYLDQEIQHAPLGKTQMGFYKERQVMAHSDRIKALSKLDQERSNQERVKNKARYEIRRVLSAMDLSLNESQALQKLFWRLYTKLQPGTKYRSVEKLVPITIYLHFKLECKAFSKQELLEVAKISKKELNSFILQLRSFIPQYNSRNRKELIMKLIIAICERYNLGMVFYVTARKVLLRFWEILKSTKDSVIAAVCCSIVSLCSINDIAVSKICDHFGIRMSTVHRQVEKKIFNQMKIEGFESLVRSADLLREVMIKLGIIDSDAEVEIKPTSLIRIKVGNALNVFSENNKEEMYLYAIKTTSGSFMMMDGPDYPLQNDNLKKIYPEGIEGKEEWLVQAIRYEYPKGPPQVLTT